MNKLSFAFSVACSALAILLAGPTYGSDKKKETPEPIRPFISAVNGDSITVTTGTSAKTLTLKPHSEVLLNGQKAAAADLKVGMPVNSVGMGTDASVVSRINVADAPATPTPAVRKKKKES